MADPSTIFTTTAPVAWFRSDTFGNSGGNLTTCPDQSGNARNLTLNGTPTYSASGGSGGHGYARFNGSTQYLTSTVIGNLLIGGNNNDTYAALLFRRVATVASGECFINLGGASSTANIFTRFVAGNSATQWEVRWRNAPSGTGPGGVGGTADNNWHLAEIIRTATTVDLIIDGVTVISGPQTCNVDMTGTTIDRFSIAALIRNTNSAFCNMDLQECVLLGAVPTAAERLAYHEYVAERYDVITAFKCTGVVGTMSLAGDAKVTAGALACTGVVGTMALDGDGYVNAGSLACTGVVGTLTRPPVKDGGIGSSTLLGDLGVTTSVVEHYTTTRLAQDPAFTFVNLGENNYTTWHLLPTGSPAPPSVPVGTLASPDEARNVTALIAAGVTRAVVNVNSDIFRLATVHGITTEAALKAFFDAYILPNYWTIYTALEAAGITTIVCAIQPRDTAGGTAATRATEAYAYTKLAAMFGARFVGGFYTYLVDVDGTLIDALTSDTTHPNDSATPTLAGYWVTAFDAIDAPGENFGDNGIDGDIACTGVVGTMALDGDNILEGDIACQGVVGVMFLNAHDAQEATFACDGVVGTMALDGDAYLVSGALACTGVVGAMALDGEPVNAGALACTGVVGVMALDADNVTVGILSCTGVVGVCAPSAAVRPASVGLQVYPRSAMVTVKLRHA